jgi:hypothetical protein
VSADLLDARVVEVEIDAAAAPDADEWLAERVGTLRAHAADGRPRIGSDCARCPFVAGCEPHSRR